MPPREINEQSSKLHKLWVKKSKEHDKDRGDGLIGEDSVPVPVLLDTAHSKAVEDEEDTIELQGSGG
ncbi:uncharacterized protein EAE97_001634 [Botrytis byssoidea]|uniref:Uncharacterized protein n=1 Tax=Botrytis byssoidea TaxID=139641 RepID=A0A9P5IY80_9HELO|nr:uncharacterized protein EAE97_001634 [Botrytis byssoidea]KAF7952137.1 hypothetical protein EAE97_001634 [Botrytis byssoidea]